MPSELPRQSSPDECGRAFTMNDERIEVYAPMGGANAAILVYDQPRGGTLTWSLALNPGHLEQLCLACDAALVALGFPRRLPRA